MIGALAAGVLLGQARLARRTIPAAESPPPRCDGVYGAEYAGASVRLAVLGDSSAAGYGVDRPRDTPGALLAAGLAERIGRPVLVRSVAVVGAVSAGLVQQREAAMEWRPDLAVILIGTNDVTHRVRAAVAVRHLADTVRALRTADIGVIVGTCPDLGTIRPIQPPLRWLARRWSREMAAAQTIATVEAGGATVSLGDLLGPEFAASPDTMFSADRFHPSAMGYATATAAILPTLVAATGIAAEARPSLARDEGVRSLAQAAVEAADRAGTEVSGARVAGRERGPAGRWAQLRHRVRQLTERPRDPVVTAGSADGAGTPVSG
jgi:lysophospholipase L1-like esterase